MTNFHVWGNENHNKLSVGMYLYCWGKRPQPRSLFRYLRMSKTTLWWSVVEEVDGEEHPWGWGMC